MWEEKVNFGFRTKFRTFLKFVRFSHLELPFGSAQVYQLVSILVFFVSHYT